MKSLFSSLSQLIFKLVWLAKSVHSLHAAICINVIKYNCIAMHSNILYLVVITVMFNKSTYSVSKDDGPVLPKLVLSKPSSTTFTFEVNKNAESGKC